jgi:endonuclease YncB( thermonuclease family)
MIENCIPSEIPWLSLEGVTDKCKVISVYDADTVTIAVPLNNKLYKVRCRLLGIDSAEKRTKNLEEKKFANEATDWLRSQIDNKIIWVKCGKWDKYGGRMLGTLYMTEKDMKIDCSINNLIVEKGYAYKYDGKKKQKFEEWFNKSLML